VNSGPDCAETRDLLPELAAGTAAGDERARALQHLSGCLECRRALAEYAEVVDELLLLAPEHDPPEGFATAVVSRLGQPAAPRRHRLRTGLLWAASLVAVAGLAAGGVWLGTADDRHRAADYRHTLDVAHGRDLSATPLRNPAGAEIGTMFAYEGDPHWVYATFRPAPPPGQYDVTLVTKDAREFPLRPFMGRPGGIAWGSTIDVSPTEVERIEFARADVPVMIATFD
jgi:Putative zinc-finger